MPQPLETKDPLGVDPPSMVPYNTPQAMENKIQAFKWQKCKP